MLITLSYIYKLTSNLEILQKGTKHYNHRMLQIVVREKIYKNFRKGRFKKNKYYTECTLITQFEKKLLG